MRRNELGDFDKERTQLVWLLKEIGPFYKEDENYGGNSKNFPKC